MLYAFRHGDFHTFYLLLCSFQRAILLRYFPICFVAALKKFRQRRLLRFLTFRSRASHLEKSLRIIPSAFTLSGFEGIPSKLTNAEPDAST